MTDYSATTSHKFLNLPNSTLYTYNLWDCHTTARLFFALRDELKDPQLGHQWDYYQSQVQPLQTAVQHMQARGILLDKAEKRRTQTKLSKELSATDALICRYADEVGFSYTDKFPNSNAQVSKLLFDHLGLRGAKRTDSGRLSSDQESLTRALRQLRVRDRGALPLLHNLFHRSRLETVRDRYFKIPVDSDSRVRPRVKITGTKTFRYAYAEPPLQQYPPEIRRMFRASPGCVLLAADYSQVQARILAILSGDNTSLTTFATPGGDVHVANTLDLFGMSIKQWEALGPESKSYRNFAKTFLYGIAFGGKSETMKTKLYCPCDRCADLVPDTVELTRPQIKAAEERWFAARPEVRRWQTDLVRDVSRQHYYESPFGVRRMIAKPWGAELEREVKNIPMQMNEALLMNQRQVRLDQAGLPIIFQMHDAFYLEVPQAQVDNIAAEVRGIMEDPCPELGGHVFPVDIEVGENWGAFGPDNPNGLRKLGVSQP